MGNLKIYKASAGSGKTHRLTGEYIRLIMSSSDSFRHILAVTFTNKATAEMKSRILSELHKKSESDQVVKERLISMLHDYSSFNISTIDKFFQGTLRAFARESGMNSSYGVELDDTMVISEAVERVISTLDLPENRNLLDWFINFSFSKIDEGKNWDIRREIEKKIDNFTKESFKMVRRELLENVNRETLGGFINQMDLIISDFEARMREIAREAEKILENYSLQFQDFKGGSRTPLNYFSRINNGRIELFSLTFKELADNFDNWITKTTAREKPELFHRMENAYADGLNRLVCEVVNQEDKFIRYKSALLVKGEIYMLGLLLEISQQIQLYSREKNILLLSETNDLLNRIINGEDAPFIYEKVGNRTDHFLLDEFQDTSRMQWYNFKPLIENSLSQGNMNLLVGDVKQSIYRWRGSDWNILNSQVEDSFPAAGIEIEELNQNWRSGDEIIEFNNLFFPFASGVCDTILDEGDNLVSSIYSDSPQIPAKEKRVKKGHVSVKFFNRDTSEKWEDSVFNELPATLLNLINHGCKYRDITFLVRTNSEGTKIAEWLIEQGYPVISEESLLLSLSPAVRKMISLLKYYNNPGDSVNNALLEFLDLNPAPDRNIIQLPLYQMCETILSEYFSQNDNTESAYLISLMDNVLEFSQSGNPDLNSFIEWYEEKSSRLTLSSPPDQNAIRVMTIHKAKGLSLEAVIIPFMDLKLQESSRDSNNYLWCKPVEEPFCKIPYLPLRNVKELRNTIFAPDYQRERRTSFVDNLNLAYVAFTRAKRELHIFAPAPKEMGSKDSQPSVAQLLYLFLKENLDGNNGWERGEWCSMSEPGKSLQLIKETNFSDIAAVPVAERLRLRYSFGELMDENNSRNLGIIMHGIMSEVVEDKDLDKVINSYLSKGGIRESDSQEIYSTLRGYLSDVQERHWFDGSYKIYNEREIIEPSSGTSRPDRIMTGEDITIIVDYKFGTNKENSHISQMKRYLRLTESIRKAKTEGYLWYPQLNEIVEVTIN